MIALDTNVLVRLLVGDDERQSARARRVIEDAQAAGEPCLVSDDVLCETAWVLACAYDATKRDLVTAFIAILDDGSYRFEDHQAVREAIDAYRDGQGDLSDYLIGVRARTNGARTTVTFDRRLRNHEAFTVLR